MIRLKREQYATGLAERGGVSVTVGIYYEVPETEDIEELTYTAQRFGQHALDVYGGNHVDVVEEVSSLVEAEYSGRPFYVETDEKGRGVQVYQPYGMPQDGSRPKYQDISCNSDLVP
jgi:hypothetical protein